MPDAPAWLRESFRDGVDERIPRDPDGGILLASTSRRDLPGCWLAQHDERRRPCSGPLERFHFVGRQRVRRALGALLPDPFMEVAYDPLLMRELVLLAEWDARNGGIACEGHHRRYDNHATPELRVDGDKVPDHVFEFLRDWGLELEAEKFGGVETMRDFTIVT